MDNEIKSSNNYLSFNGYGYDPKTGRRWRPDPKESEYPFISPYAYALNSPLLFIDPDGRDVIVAFGGIDYNHSGDAGSALDLVNNLKVWAEANKIEDFDAEPFASDWFDNAHDKALKFIEDNYSEGEKIIIYGYSWGGDNAVELTETLKEKGYDVDLLIVVDGAKGPLSGDLGDWVDREIPDNTKEVTNYYQTNPSRIRSRGNEAKAKDSKKTNVMNVKVTTEDITHSNIDEEVAPLVEEEIKRKVKINE
jgi:RHS repeat-associated protein